MRNEKQPHPLIPSGLQGKGRHAGLISKGGRAGLLVLLLLVWPARAADSFGDVEISLGEAPVGNNAHGYSEYRFYVRNKGSEPATVAISLPAQSQLSSGCIASVSRRIEVGPGSGAWLSLAYPARPSVIGHDAIVTVDGKQYERRLGISLSSGAGSMGGGMGYRGGKTWRPFRGGVNESLVLHSQELPEHFFTIPAVAAPGLPPGVAMPGAAVPGGAMPGRGGGSRIQGQALRATGPVSGWSDNWLAYSRYDGVAVTPRDLAGLASEPRTQPVLQALWRYVETGGVLLVVGPGDLHLPATWKRLSRQNGAITVYQVGFGQCLHCSQSDPARWFGNDWIIASSAFNLTGQPWQHAKSIRDLQNAFPVVDDLGVPVRGLFILMIVFAAAIGPLNLWILSRMKRRIWLLWTVPAISAFTCLVVLGYTVFGEGWTGRARLGSITLLDQVGDRAATLAHAAYYSPLTPGGGLSFPEDAEVQSMGDDHPSFSSSCAIEWKGEQHLSRGWVTARIPVHFALRRSKVSPKLRLNLHKNANGTLSVVNALDADIRTLTVADDTGRLFTGGPIPAGAEATLEPRWGKAENGLANHWRTLYANTGWGMADPENLRPEDSLVPSSYLAVLEQSPFLEPGLRGAVRRPSPAIVIGLYSGLEMGK